MHRLFDLDGKVARSSPAATRVSDRAWRVALAEAGADIVGVNRSDAAATRAAVEATGPALSSTSRRISASTRGHPGGSSTSACRAFGRIDILVNNAGIIRRADALDFTEKDWDDVIDVNLKTVFFLSQAVGQAVRRAGWRRQDHQHRVDALLPGRHPRAVLHRVEERRRRPDAAARQRMGEAPHQRQRDRARATWRRTTPPRCAPTPSAIARSSTRIPAGRWGTPADLAGAVVFLASAASDYVHGHTLAVDGGWLAR